jgi:hypothetical protein
MRICGVNNPGGAGVSMPFPLFQTVSYQLSAISRQLTADS